MVKKAKALFMLAGMLAVIVSVFLYRHPWVVYAGVQEESPVEAYRFLCEKIGGEYGISPELLQAVIEAESGGRVYAVGKRGELGLMQIYPEYHMNRLESLEVCSGDSYSDMLFPGNNIRLGAGYLAELFLEYEDPGTVLMVYNGTKNAAERGIRGDYTEYASGILQRAMELERLHGK